MALLTLPEIKTFIGARATQTTEYDDRLAMIRDGVEGSVARRCSRSARLANGTETCTLEYTENVEEKIYGVGRMDVVQLRMWPVAKINSINGHMFADPTTPTSLDNQSYALDEPRGRIVVARYFKSYWRMFQMLVVNYNGGYIADPLPPVGSENPPTPPAGATTLDKGLREALLEAIRWKFEKGSLIGLAKSSEGISDTELPQQLLPLFDRFVNYG